MKPHDYFGRRSSSACAKYAEALRKSRWSAATRGSRFQFLQSLPFVCREPAALTAVALSLAHPLPQGLGCQPNLLAIDVIAAHCDGCSGPCSCTIRMARSRTSEEYLRVVPWAHPLKE